MGLCVCVVIQSSPTIFSKDSISESKMTDEIYTQLEGDHVAQDSEFINFAKSTRPKISNSIDVTSRGLKLMPSPIKISNFAYLKQVSALMSVLMSRLIMDSERLLKCLESSLNDPFISKLVYIYNKVPRDRTRFDFYRHDYMQDSTCQYKLVESNTISVSMKHIGTITQNYQRTIIEKMISNGTFPTVDIDACMPKQNSCKAFVVALERALSLKGQVAKGSFVLIVIENNERNTVDVSNTAEAMRDAGMEAILIELGEVYASYKNGDLKLGDQNKLLLTRNKIDQVVDIVYWRSFFTPKQITEEGLWDFRLLIETSAALKIPTVGAQLAGAKDVQRAFTDREIIKQILPPKLFANEKAAEYAYGLILSTGVPQYVCSALNEKSKTAMKIAIANPSDWVLKPNTEGGGQNLFGDDMKNRLSDILNGAEFQPFVLMKKIKSPTHKSLLIDDSGIESNMMIPEIGIYCIYVDDLDGVSRINISQGRKEITSGSTEFLGYICRSKKEGVNECGIMSGNGVLDGLFVMPE